MCYSVRAGELEVSVYVRNHLNVDDGRGMTRFPHFRSPPRPRPLMVYLSGIRWGTDGGLSDACPAAKAHRLLLAQHEWRYENSITKLIQL